MKNSNLLFFYMIFFDDALKIIESKNQIGRNEAKQLFAKLKQQTITFFHQNDKIVTKTKFIGDVELKRFDVVTSTILGMPHPGLVIKMDKEFCYVVTLTSSETHSILKLKKSRFFKDKHVSPVIQKIPIDEAKSKFVLPYDSISEAREIYKIVKEYYTKIFK